MHQLIGKMIVPAFQNPLLSEQHDASVIVIGHGRIPDVDMQLISEAEALEVVANVVLNIFTNYVNLVAGTEIDFPIVRARKAA